MRVAYLGTSDFAATVLRGMHERGVRPVLVVAPPDRPQGRRQQIASPPAAVAARELGLEVVQTADVNADSTRAAIAGAGPDVGLVCAFGQIIREPLLTDLELWNIHPSLLPRWRGAAPIERAIMAGDGATGVTIARVTAGLDSGPVALESRVTIKPDDDRGTLGERLGTLAVEIAAVALDRLVAADLPATEQGEGGATYAEKIDPAERRLDPTRPAVELERTVRALHPHIGAYLELEGGHRLGVGRAAVEDEDVAVGMLDAEAGTLRLGCSPGALRLERVKPAGGREMSAAEYLRGHPGPRLGLT